MARRPEGAAAGRSAPRLAISRRGCPRRRAVAADARHLAPRDHEERRARGGGGPCRLDRRADGRRSRARAARHRRRRRPVERAFVGDRHGHRDRRPGRPGRRCGAAAAGGRHVSRHRDFRRQHRDPRRPDDRRVPAGRSAGTYRDAGVDRPAGRLRTPGGRRRIGRSRHAHGGRLPCRPCRRPAQPAAERLSRASSCACWRRNRCRSPTRRSS